MGIDKELIDKLLEDYKSPEDIVGESGLLKQLTKALVERALHAELTTHLGYEKPGRQRAGQHAQRDEQQAAERRLRHGGDRGAAGPTGKF